MFDRIEHDHIMVKIEEILREMQHPALPGPGEPIHFVLHVHGKADDKGYAIVMDDYHRKSRSLCEVPIDESRHIAWKQGGGRKKTTTQEPVFAEGAD